jgi:hypothetical protein
MRFFLGINILEKLSESGGWRGGVDEVSGVNLTTPRFAKKETK